MDCNVVMKAYKLRFGQNINRKASRIEQFLEGQRFACDIARAVGRCNVEIPYHYTMAPRIYEPGTQNGAIKEELDLDKLVFVKLTPEHWDEMKRLVDARGDLAVSASISTGIGHIWQTMDLTAFSIACAENHDLLRDILERYTEWTCSVLEKINTIGLDFVWSFDDFAFKTGPLYSPAILREVVLPYARQVANAIKLPWIFHSDGDLTLVLDDLVSLGMNALNPIEPGCTDVAMIREKYPHLTLVGNVDVNLLANGTPEQVRAFVQDMFREMNQNNRFIPSSGNSIPDFARPENVRSMIDTIWECSGQSLPPFKL